MNPVTLWLADVGIKIAKALFKKQYEVSKKKLEKLENEKTNTVGDNTDNDDGVRESPKVDG